MKWIPIGVTVLLALLVSTLNAMPPAATPASASTKELLEQFVKTQGSYQQCDVAHTLAKRKDSAEVVKAMLPHLAAENRCTRCNAGYVLASHGDDRGFDAVLKELTDDTPRPAQPDSIRSDGKPDVAGQIISDRYYAAGMLAALKDARAVPALVKMLDAPRLDCKAAYALGAIGSRDAIEPLKAAVGQGGRPEFQVFALWALAKLGESSGTDRLLDVLHTGAAPQRARAAELLGSLKDPRILPALTAVLSDDEIVHVRRQAIYGLMLLGDPAAIPALEKAMKDETPVISGATKTISDVSREAIARLRSATAVDGK
jgi:hypothetical protein